MIVQFYNISNKQMQTVNKCPHYQRNCHIEAPCCKVFFPCKLCHDDKYEYKKGCQVERMQFDKVEKVLCLSCQTIQAPSEKCEVCQEKFGTYACLKCRLYENNPLKVGDIFHCDLCKMCRRGTTDTVTHCHKCSYCVPNASEHKCIDNVGSSSCPVCLQQLHFSTKGYISMKCGHLIHVKCWTMLKDINCPSCGLANQKMDEATVKLIDEQIEKTIDQLPKEVKDKKVKIWCHQCTKSTSDVPFHFHGLKCGHCGTYNTKMI